VTPNSPEQRKWYGNGMGMGMGMGIGMISDLGISRVLDLSQSLFITHHGIGLRDVLVEGTEVEGTQPRVGRVENWADPVAEVNSVPRGPLSRPKSRVVCLTAPFRVW
jgi:hypothetical protein